MKMIFLIIIGILAVLLCTLSIFLAKYCMTGYRQTMEESMKWQTDHYDLSWYNSLETENYTVSSYDGYLLHATWCKCPSSSKGFVILSHGYTDTRYGSLKYAKIYLDAGFHCIIYDLRGHGENEKTICTYSVRESRDLHALIQDTRARFGQDIKIGLHGESLGAATTAAVLKYDQDLAFCVADCGFADIINVLKVGLKQMHLPGWLVYPASLAAKLRYGYGFNQMRPIDSLAGNAVPILFIHGEKDDFIVPENSKRMCEAANGRLVMIPDAGHAQSVLVHRTRYEEEVDQFLAGQ